MYKPNISASQLESDPSKQANKLYFLETLLKKVTHLSPLILYQLLVQYARNNLAYTLMKN